jgi:hypothetical protein
MVAATASTTTAAVTTTKSDETAPSSFLQNERIELERAERIFIWAPLRKRHLQIPS